jgi:hypothetical protein
MHIGVQGAGQPLEGYFHFPRQEVVEQVCAIGPESCQGGERRKTVTARDATDDGPNSGVVRMPVVVAVQDGPAPPSIIRSST